MRKRFFCILSAVHCLSIHLFTWPVLPVEVQVIYISSHLWRPTVLWIVRYEEKKPLSYAITTPQDNSYLSKFHKFYFPGNSVFGTFGWKLSLQSPEICRSVEVQLIYWFSHFYSANNEIILLVYVQYKLMQSQHQNTAVGKCCPLLSDWSMPLSQKITFPRRYVIQ